ncbi:MAG: DNA alkylation repair protein [Chlorobiales bacterium]|nr:DNA alkylation repair protein [Chlorobiales bacterium]
MKVEQILKELEALGNDKTKAHYQKTGAGDNLYGVKLGDLRKLAKKIKVNHDLALNLWNTGNIDARFLAILIMKLEALSAAEVDELLRSINFVRVADWFIAYIIRKHPDKEELRQKWMKSEDHMAARAGWDLTSERVAKSPDGIDIPALLTRIESQMKEANEISQWTMNITLATIGIHHPEYREKALEIGEALGVYRDYPVSKGCTSPFAPIWINEMVKRQS